MPRRLRAPGHAAFSGAAVDGSSLHLAGRSLRLSVRTASLAAPGPHIAWYGRCFTLRMARTHAVTVQLAPSEPDIHSRVTRIVRRPRDGSDGRATLVCVPAARGATCRTCSSLFDQDAQFCGSCGERARTRVSLVGMVLDDLYEIEGKLAEGQTSTIYRARYLPSGQEIAVKVLHSELAYDAIVLARFRREGKVLARLRDARTVAVYDHGQTADGTVYIAMELLRGEGLDVRLRTQGAMPWREVLAVMRAVCSSLGEAHAQGIVHRNLKPENIRLGRDGGVKVIDFGLAKIRRDAADDELTLAGQTVGSLQYMAPEQVAGQTCDGRADLYALGLIALEMVLGRTRNANAAPAVLPDHIPRHVERVLQRCLVADPTERITSAGELGQELDEILAGNAVRATSALPHTSAFELQPARIVIDAGEPEIEISYRASGGWKLWLAAVAMCAVGVGTAVAGCV